jgi:hypothetical protein
VIARHLRTLVLALAALFTAAPSWAAAPDCLSYHQPGDTSDAEAVNRCIAANAGTPITLPAITIDKPIAIVSNTDLHITGDIKVTNSRWPAAIASAPWVQRDDRTTWTDNVRIEFVGRATLRYMGTSTYPTKGIGIATMRHVLVVNPRVIGGRTAKPETSLFAMFIVKSQDVEVTGGYLSVLSGWVGSDGIKIQNSFDVKVHGVEINSGDDCISVTDEAGSGDSARIAIYDNSLTTTGFSVFKMLGGTTGHRLSEITFRNNNSKPGLTQPGAGAPFILDAQGGVIDHVSITKGRVLTLVPPGGLMGNPTFQIRGATNVTIDQLPVTYYARSVLVGTDCTGLVFRPTAVTVTPNTGPLPKNAQPLVSSTRCPRAVVTLPDLAQPAWKGQALVAAQ